MKKRHKIMAGFVVLLLGVCFYSAWQWHQPETRLRRQLHDVVRLIGKEGSSLEETLAAFESFETKGSENIPVLVEIVVENREPGENIWERIYPKLPPALQKSLPSPVDRYTLKLFGGSALQQALRRKADAGLIASLMRHQEPDVRLAATEAMVRSFQEGGKMSLSTFYPEFENPDNMVQNAVLIIIIRTGDKAQGAQQKIVKLLEHKDEPTRYNAALAVLSTGGATNLATAVLESLTQSKSVIVHYHAALTLANPPPKPNPWIRLHEVNGFNVIPPPPLTAGNSVFPWRVGH